MPNGSGRVRRVTDVLTEALKAPYAAQLWASVRRLFNRTTPGSDLFWKRARPDNRIEIQYGIQIITLMALWPALITTPPPSNQITQVRRL